MEVILINDCALTFKIHFNLVPPERTSGAIIYAKSVSLDDEAILNSVEVFELF